MTDSLDALVRAADAVCGFDWSDNDDDAVLAISRLRLAVVAVKQQGDKTQDTKGADKSAVTPDRGSAIPPEVAERARAYLALAEKATPGPLQLSLSRDVTGYPTFAICGIAGDQKHDQELHLANGLFLSASHEAAAIIRAMLAASESGKP